jgi:hypothetical protein
LSWKKCSIKSELGVQSDGQAHNRQRQQRPHHFGFHDFFVLLFVVNRR